MLPALKPGDVVVCIRVTPRPGQLILANVAGKDVVKRVSRADAGSFYLLGDNREQSTDSRHYGAVTEAMIKGVIVMRLPFSKLK